MAKIELQRYCSCGIGLNIESNDVAFIGNIDESFTHSHNGVGHQPVTRKDWMANPAPVDSTWPGSDKLAVES